MANVADQRQELILQQIALFPNGGISAFMQSWQAFAIQLISIIGEDGFLALYSRSLQLLHTAFPKLPSNELLPSSTSWLTELEIALIKLDLTEAASANHQLLLTLTNILASLIGEELTNEILISAWGETATSETLASKEMKDDK